MEDKYSFVQFIMQCCKSPEGDLRRWLKKTLIKNGFAIKEDEYKTSRSGKGYENVHNMLAIRGNPLVCLVSHTDVCRDHGSSFGNFGMYGDYDDEFEYSRFVKCGVRENYQQNHSSTSQSKQEAPIVEPVIKFSDINGKLRQIIQDKDCKTQVGGDDRLGVAINTWIALNTGYDVALLFTTDEEIGLKSAEAVNFPELSEFELLCQTDRGNHSNQLVLKIGSQNLCGYMTASRLLEIAFDLGMPRKPVVGASTDVYAIKKRGLCKNAVNMTCGYHDSISSSPKEYIDIEEARDTMKYVAHIVRDYYLRSIGIDPDINDEENIFTSSNQKEVMVTT